MIHANIGSYGALGACKKKALEVILEICQGLPLSFGIAGATVRQYCEEGVNEQNAWNEYQHDLKKGVQNIATGETKLYGSLELIVDRSLEVFDSRTENKNWFSEMFHGFCVLRKNQSVGAEILKDLWSLRSLSDAPKVA